MFTPLTHVATALSFFASAQLALPPISRMWVREPTHRCSSASHERFGDKPVARKTKSTSGRSASPSVQIVTFGP
jgi:hypothetical protein